MLLLHNSERAHIKGYIWRRLLNTNWDKKNADILIQKTLTNENELQDKKRRDILLL